MTYWPGTNTAKSNGNAFDWKPKPPTKPPEVAKADAKKQHIAAKKAANKRKHKMLKAALRVNPESFIAKSAGKTNSEKAPR
jgi:hypothetical protein